MSQSFVLILRGILLGCSFTGLCALVRCALKLDRFIAPFFTACALIGTLMLAGMLRVLPYAFYTIYIGGFGGLAYAYLFRKLRPAYGVIGLLGIFTIYLIFRFYPCKLFLNDDISHWGLVARYLLNHNAFPDASTEVVYFQSYPLGTASFIYYICRTLANEEGLWLISQNFLMGLFFLPLLSNIRGNRRYLYPIAAILFVYLFKHTRTLVNLQVDWLMGFFGIGVASALAFYSRDIKKAMLVAIPAMIAVVYIKSSGLFFAAFTVLALVWIVRRTGHRRKTVLTTLLAGTLIFAGAYLAWILHVRLSYSAALSTKHAVSLTAYAQELGSKSSEMILTIAQGMVAELIPGQFYEFAPLLVLALVAVTSLLIGFRDPRRRAELPRVYRAMLIGVGIYAVWYVMLFLMYLFSMPEGEAEELASIYRYNATGLVFMIGLQMLILFRYVGRTEVLIAPTLRLIYRILAVVTVTGLCLVGIVRPFFYQTLLTPDPEYMELRKRILRAKDELDITSGGKYLVYFNDGEEDMPYSTLFFHLKYEYDSVNFAAIFGLETPIDGNGYMYVDGENATPGADPVAYLQSHLDQYDALIVIHKNEAFEDALHTYLASGEESVPVCYAYES